MRMPTWDEHTGYLFRRLAAQSEHTSQQMVEDLAANFRLAEERRKELLPSGRHALCKPSGLDENPPSEGRTSEKRWTRSVPDHVGGIADPRGSSGKARLYLLQPI